jgi:hypothetical protein
MIDLSYFPRDPANDDRVVGWAVYHPETWHLFGFFTSEAEANSVQIRAGADYIVAHGSNTVSGDNFIKGSSEVSAAIFAPKLP